MIYDMTDYSQLIRFDKNGLTVASYTEIRSFITQRYKEIYGYDIDLSTGTADGQFIEMMSLMMNNILLTLKSMYAGLDANYAEGKMLDIIASLTNVQRRKATYSTASLVIENTSSETFSLSSLDFIDKNGTIWTWTASTPETFGSADKSIIVTCSEPGPVKAPAGWISSTALNYPFIVTQQHDAIVGLDAETDSQLRARRNSSLALSGLTSLESVQASLLNITGIEDVLIYNNASNATFVGNKDTTEIGPHQVYVCIKQNANISIENSLIGNLIYEKLTPGIQTCPMKSTEISGQSMSSNYETGSGVQQTVYWKKCIAVHPTIVITISKLSYFDNSTINLIADKIKTFCNDLHISSNLLSQEIFVQAMNADPRFRGAITFTVDSATVNGSTSYTNTDTFYNYTTMSYDDTTTPGKVVITIQ